MGLAGRKQKQRIPADPRNLSWADDASRFGLSYLSKFGWDASKGLGSSGDGMKTHLKVQQKLDMMGIGAEHQRDPNGIAWKQNKEFEALLKRLNETAENGKGASGEDAEGEDTSTCETAMNEPFVRAREEKIDRNSTKESSVTTKKRKHEDGDDLDSGESRGKKKKEKKRYPKSSPDDAIQAASESSSVLSPSEPHSEPIPKSRPMAHRARIRAAKRIAGKSASAIAEILGISPSTSVSTSESTPAPTPPSSSTPTPQPSLSLDNLTTSTKSVADYFKEKLIARSSSSSSPASSSLPSGSVTPGLGANGRDRGLSPPEDESELPRRGIGSQAPVSLLPPQVPEAGSTPAGGDSTVDDRDVTMERQRRKEERKAEKRKRREAEVSQAIREDVSTALEERVGEDGAESAQRTSKKEKKRHERKEQVSTRQSHANDGDDTEKRRERDAPNSPLVEPKRKPKKKPKDGR